MENRGNAKANPLNNVRDMSAIVRKMSEVGIAVEQYNIAVEQYKAENPDTDVEAILSEHRKLLPVLGLSPNRELDKFIAYAKEQGTKMPFDAMEMGVLTAGRKDMQDGLAEILNALEFGKPICPDCDEKMDNRGRSKKKS